MAKFTPSINQMVKTPSGAGFVRAYLASGHETTDILEVASDDPIVVVEMIDKFKTRKDYACSRLSLCLSGGA